MKITHVAEIVNIGHVARILEAEICGAENVRAIPMYNHFIAVPIQSTQNFYCIEVIGTSKNWCIFPPSFYPFPNCSIFLGVLLLIVSCL